MGDGGETIDFIQWMTTSAVDVAGYSLIVSGDGFVQFADRSTQLVELRVDGNLVDAFDLDGMSGIFDREFSGGEVNGTTFRIEFTRHNSGAGSGSRIRESDAMVNTSDPGSLALLAIGGLLLLHRRRAPRVT